MMEPNFTGKPITAQHLIGGGGGGGRGGGGLADFVDLDQMPDTPNRAGHHRRAQSETFFRFPDLDDDILLDDVVFDLPPAPSLSSEGTTPVQHRSSNNNSEAGGVQVQAQPARLNEKAHLRSLSMDADFFEGLNFGPSTSSSVDCTGGPFSVTGAVDDRKTTSADRLQEIALNDPKRAKRILANRQSAARSKERKIRYTSELERKVQTLQTEATTLSAQVTMLQRDTTGLTSENKELKLRLQAMEQQAHLRDALNEALRDEVQRLKIAAGQIPTANGNNFNRAMRPQFSAQAQAFNHFGNNQADQQQQQQHLHLHVPQSGMNNSAFSTQPKPGFLGFDPPNA